MTSSEGTPGAPSTPCRRAGCMESAISGGLCARHWARWQDDADELNLADDDYPAPPRQIWQPPTR